MAFRWMPSSRHRRRVRVVAYRRRRVVAASLSAVVLTPCQPVLNAFAYGAQQAVLSWISSKRDSAVQILSVRHVFCAFIVQTSRKRQHSSVSMLVLVSCMASKQ